MAHLPSTSSTNENPTIQQPQKGAASTSTFQGGGGLSKMKINKKRQDGNPVLKYIRNVVYEWDSEIKCDFECSKNCGILYLSLKYHKLHAGYIETRLNDLNGYQIKVLLVHSNVEDPSFLLRDLNMLCYRTCICLVLCYSVEEAAEYIEHFKSTENRKVDKVLADIQQRKAARIAANEKT